MTRLILLIICFAFINQAVGQTSRYTERIFSEIDTLLDVEYANADFLNNPIQLFVGYNIHEGEAIAESRPLYMDIFKPKNDTLTKRPALIFAHSGAFLIGSRKNDDMLAMCDSFAQRGYVTATMDYRKGMGSVTTRWLGALIGLKVTKDNGYRAIYRAAQDSKAAVRFLKHNADIYGIDTTKIYMVGSSAGAITSLYNLYLDEEKEIPAAALKEPTLGRIDTVGIQGYGSKVNAVASFWGAIEDVGIIGNEKSPVFLIHGMADEMVPFKKGIPMVNMIESNPAYSLELPETFGSFCLDTALINRSIPHENYFMADEEHEFYGVNTGMFPDEGPNVYWDTVQWKLKQFFYDLVRPVAEFQVNTNGLKLSFSNSSIDIFTSEWDFGDGNTGIGQHAEHGYAEPGDYRIKLTTCNRNLACDTISKIVKAGTPVGVYSNRTRALDIFPNPAFSEINIKGVSGERTVHIFDLTGNKIQIIHNQSNPINISNLENGIYIFGIENGGEMVFRKFIKKD